MMVRSALLLVAVLVAGCASQDGGQGTGQPPSDESALVGRTFLAQSVTGYQLAADGTISLTFPERGKILASGGCNSMFGDVAVEGDKLVITNMGGTDMACDKPRMDQDDWMVKFLTAKPTWTLTGDDLVLKTADAEVKLVDRKVPDPDRPLAGTRWVVDTLIDGEAASSVPQGAEAYLEFQGDRVTGNTGCNQFGGSFVHAGGTITFADIAATKMACPGDVNALERKVLAVLDGQVTAAINADRLVLSHPSGQGLQLRAVS